MTISRTPAALGSSPRGRGKPMSYQDQRGHRGLIPAWAGKTLHQRTAPSSRAAHPRVGGENRTLRPILIAATGSSPRGRGKPPDEIGRGVVHGLIPAWAGKTRRSRAPPSTRRAHPRVGGENPTPRSPEAGDRGSSPRGRGKRFATFRTPEVSGLIPAWAGKTRPGDRAVRQPRAHPRVGGENSVIVYSVPGSIGSSPRGRGKQLRRPAQVVHVGLIPAWAGKTRSRLCWTPSSRAHPRVGGENGHLRAILTNASGSSPRGRGKPRRAVLDRDDAGLIPAWAGKTHSAEPRQPRGRAHPRVGGENTF